MKNLFSFLSFALIALIFNSCASPKGGGVNGTERSSFSSGGVTSLAIPGLEQRSNQSNDNTNTNSEIGFYIGVFFTDINLAEKLELQPEVLFIGIKNLNQIQVPILAKYNIAEKFNAYLGPNFGYLLDAPTGIKSFNLGADVGISYDISDKFVIETRYNYGFSNLLENGSSSNSIKLSNLSFGVGYKLN